MTVQPWPRDPRITGSVAIAAAWWLLSDHMAVWAPSLITIFGQAASTPPELMGLFALGCVLASFPLARAARDPRGAWAVLGIAIAARVVLAFVPGGQVQLWAASAGLAAALAAWFAVTVHAHGRALAPGLGLGWLATTSVSALGGTWWSVWRPDAFGVAAGAVLATLLLLTATSITAPATPPGRRQAWTLMPLALVAGISVVNAGRASTVDDRWGPSLLVAGCALGVVVAWRAPRGLLVRLVAALVALSEVAATLYGTTGEVPGSLGRWTLMSFVLAPAALVVLLGEDDHARPARPGALLGGAVVWVIGFFAYYAGYDLGYRADALVVALVGVLGALAVLCARRTSTPDPDQSIPDRSTPEPDPTGGRVVAAPVVLALVIAAVAVVHDPVSRAEVPATAPEVSVAAWNVGMGYGPDGTFRPEEVADLVGDVDVVLLSEIDRGWLLNGGQDQLAILARLTGKRLYFAPAADPVWGDAVLTSLPVSDVQGHPLPSYGAVTGAGALAVRLDVAGSPVWAVSTHVQPTTTREDGTIDQAGDLADLVTELERSAPVLLGGDFNFEPDTPSFQRLLDAGLSDVLAEDRPLPTWPSAEPVQQIDHLFTTSGLSRLSGTAPGYADTLASDHLPVGARLRVAP